jgi:hypothetical protein
MAEKEVLTLQESVKIIGKKHDNPKKQKLIPGKEYIVHPRTAENLIASGHAVTADEAAKTKK